MLLKMFLDMLKPIKLLVTKTLQTFALKFTLERWQSKDFTKKEHINMGLREK